MRTFRFRDDEQGQCSVEYTLLVALVVLAIVGFAMGYHASISGVSSVAISSLTAAASVLPQLPNNAPVGNSPDVRGWNNERPVNLGALPVKLTRGFRSAAASLLYGATPATTPPQNGTGR